MPLKHIPCGGPRKTFKEVQEYKHHKMRLKHIAKKTDNRAPHLATEKYYDASNHKNDFNRAAIIEAQNRALIQNISVTYRTKGKVDSTPPKPLKWSNYITRLINNKIIEKKNLKIYENIMNAPKYYGAKEFEAAYEEIMRRMKFMSQHPEFYDKHVKENVSRWSIFPPNFDKSKCNPQKRVRCYFDISIENERKLGRMVFEIYRDIAPIAGDNFIAFCSGYNNLSYKGTPFHRIVPDCMYMGGDVTNKNGIGGATIYNSKYFRDENHILKFSGPGVISTYNLKEGKNNSQFLILCRPLEILNERFVVFGRLVQGTRILHMIGEFGTKTGKAIRKVIVSECGVLPSPT